MKTKLIFSLLLLGFYLISCKKDSKSSDNDITKQKLLGKWNNTTSTFISNNFVDNSVHDTTTVSNQNGEYYDFRSDGSVAINDFTGLDTIPYVVLNDTSISIGPDAFYVSRDYTIKILSGTTLELYAKTFGSQHMVYETTLDFSK